MLESITIVAMFRLLFYFFTIYIICEISVRICDVNGSAICFCQRRYPKISISASLIISAILGFYSVICGTLREGTDRWNYADNFINAQWRRVGSDSKGLEYVERLLSKISTNGYFLVFAIAFISSILTLIALNIFETDGRFLFLLGTTQYFIFSFYLFKQTIALSIVVISIGLLFKKKYIASLILIFIAGMFHVSAFIMLPIYLVLYFSKYRGVRAVCYFACIAIFPLFFFIKEVVIEFLQQYMPYIASQAMESFGSPGDINYMTGIKGLPFYLITLYAGLNFQYYSKKIAGFRQLYMLSFFASVFTGLSIYFYWMYRFGAYCYLPSLILAQKIHKSSKKNQELYYLSVISSLFFTARYLGLKFIVDGGF